MNYVSRAEVARSTVARAFSWMSAGLILSGLSAYAVATSPYLLNLFFSNMAIIFVLFALQIGLVVVLSGALKQLSYSTSVILFLAYAALSGVTLSSIFLVYTLASITKVFFITAGMFGVAAAYGAFTKENLLGLGRILTMGLIGLIIAFIVNIFIQSTSFDLVLSIAAVVLFTLLTAYDTQMLLTYADQASEHPSYAGLFSIRMALALYLDFVNMFIYLLRLFGQRRD